METADVTATGHETADEDGTRGGAARSRGHPFAGDGEVRALCRALDWAATPLGPVERWPAALRAAVRLCLDSGFPMCVFGGPELTLVYNDGYREALGAAKHPWALGRPAREVWAEIWGEVGPELARVLAGGAPVRHEHRPLVIRRDGRPEETFWTYAFSPVREEDGAVVGVHGVLTGTSARARAEAAVRDGEAFARALVDHLPGGAAFVVDHELRYRLAGGEAFRAAGFAPEAFVGRTVDEVLDAALAAEHAPRFRRALDGEAFVVEHAAHGREFISRGVPLRDPRGRVVAALAVSYDVTERRHVETTLHASEARYRALFESIDEGFCVLEVLVDGRGVPVDYRFLEANPAFGRQTGLVDAIGRTARELVPGLEDHWVQAYGRVALTGEPARFQQGSDAMARWFDVYAFRVGRPEERRVALLFKDISAAKAAERERERLLAALKVERERLAEVIRRAPAFMVVLRGPELVLELVNDAYQQLIGHRDVVGRPLFDAVPEARGQGFEELMARVVETGESFVGRGLPVRLARTPGAPLEERILDLAYVPLTEADGTRSGVVVLGTDVTEQERGRREVERLLAQSERARADAEAARAAADAANRAKGEFLAVMSHELRTPLNAIGGYAELLELGLRGPVTEAQRADLARIQQSQRHLLGLINQVLNYTRVDAGAVRYELADVPVGEALAAAEALIVPQVRARGLSYALGGVAPGLAVRADREKLQQVLLNLLSNAIKFTDPGGEIRVACAERGGAVAITVADTGVGVAPEKLASIFEPFVQADQRLTRPHEGVGLGLAISRDLARGMGGDLTAESTPGVGSAFTLTVPLAAPAAGG